MSYGETLKEKIKVIMADYENSIKAYTAMTKLFKSEIDLNNPDNLKIMVKECRTCHESLFGAFENTLKVLTGELNGSQTGKMFPSLLTLARKLHNISTDPKKGKYPDHEVDYSAVQKVDLNAIVTTKNARNDLTHTAVIREARHYERLFENLKRLIGLLVPGFIKPVPLISTDSNNEIFGHFFRYVEEFNAPSYSCAYILLMDSVWDIPDEQVAFLLSLPWDAVIDLDGRGIGKEGRNDRSRIEKVILGNGEETISIFALNADSNVYSSTVEKIPYLNFSDGDISLNLDTEKHIKTLKSELTQAKKKNPVDNKDVDDKQNRVNTKMKKLSALDEFLKECLKNYDRAIIVSLAEVFTGDNSAQQVVRIIADKFNFDLKLALVQDAVDNNVTLPEGFNESMYMNSNCELNVFFNSVYQNKGLVEGCISVADKNKDKDGYRFILRDKTEKIIPRNSDAIKNAEEYFEFIHLDVGQEYSQDDVERFYRGHIAEWSALKNNCAAQIAPDTQEKLCHKLVSSFTTDPEVENIYYLMHEPGSGGTTFGRRIAWDIHKNFLVVVLKRFDNKLINRIDALYKALDYTPFLILADIVHGISEDDIDNFIKMMKSKRSELPPVVAFVVRRERPDSPHGKNISFLPKLNKNNINAIKTKCMEYARRLYDSMEEMQHHVQELEENIEEKNRTPMIINMYIMDKNFKTPKEYVRSLINKDNLPDNILTILKYVSIYSLYTDNYLSINYLASVYNANGMTSTSPAFQSTLKSFDKLLLFRYGNDRVAKRKREPDGVRCIHKLFAEEIMCYLLGDNWKRNKLGSESLNFMESAMSSLTNEKTTEALQWLFARRNEKFNEDIDTHIMSPLINAVINEIMPSAGIDLLKNIAVRIEGYIKENITRIKEDKTTDYSHILNLSARLWAQCARFYRSVSYDEALMDEYTNKSLETLDGDSIEGRIGFQDLYHMAGKCWYKKLRVHLEEAPDDSSDENIAQIKKIYEKAIYYYEECVSLGNIDYGLPDMMGTYALVLQYIFNMLGFLDKEYRPERLDNDKFNWVQKDVIDAANILIDNVEQYEFDDEARTIFDKYTFDFRHTYLLGNNSKVLQDLSNYIDRLKLDGQEHPVSLQQAYSQMVYFVLNKYYNKLTKRYDYLSLSANKDDLKKIKNCVDSALEYSGNRSNFIYRTWFKFAKLEDIPFPDAYQRANDWATVLGTQRRSSGQRPEFSPYYYKYIISLLSGQPEQFVARNWEQLQKNIYGNINREEWIWDYYNSNKTGLGRLVDRDWATHDDILNNDMVSWVDGRIVHISEDETVGWIDVPELKHLKKRQHKGEGQIFFKPHTAEKTLRQKMEEVKLKFGFTLTRFRAVDVTLLDRKPREKDKGGEFNSVNMQHGGLQFVPEKLTCNLLIGKVGGEKAALHISDLRKYTPSELDAFGGEREVLRLLAKVKSFYVTVDRNSGKGLSVSIYETSQKLKDILK